jgi:hypothetical protein
VFKKINLFQVVFLFCPHLLHLADSGNVINKVVIYKKKKKAVYIITNSKLVRFHCAKVLVVLEERNDSLHFLLLVTYNI